jgi:hypothetical protein
MRKDSSDKRSRNQFISIYQIVECPKDDVTHPNDNNGEYTEFRVLFFLLSNLIDRNDHSYSFIGIDSDSKER